MVQRSYSNPNSRFLLAQLRRATYSLGWVPEVFDGNQRAKGVAHQHVLYIDQPTRGSCGCLSESSECSVASTMRASQRALTHVVQLDVVVVRGQDFFKVRREPRLCIGAQDNVAGLVIEAVMAALLILA